MEASTRRAEDVVHAGGSGLDTSPNRLRLSIVDVTLALFCLIPPLAFGSQLLNSDGDAARHIRMGDLMLERGLHVNDPFSFTVPAEPIMLTEWGSRILYALAHGWGGLAGVALLAGLAIGVSLALLVLFLLRRGVDPLLAYLTGLATGVLGQVHWLARPHLFTLVALPLLLFLLESDSKRRAWGFGLLFAVWANLHGGYVLGFALIGAYLAGALAEAWLSGKDRALWLARARRYGVAGAVSVLASFANPEGPGALIHVVELLRSTDVTGSTYEFMSPNFHDFYAKFFLLVLCGTMAVFAVVDRRPPLTRLAAVLLMVAGGLLARRNIPLYGMVALPLLVLHADAAWRSIRLRAVRHVAGVFETGERIARPGVWAPAAVIVLVLLTATRGRIGDTQLVPNDFDPDVFPVAAVEYAREAGISGRIFNFFTWGGYIIYAWPGQQIFIDGMTDYFGADVLKDYRVVYRLERGWADVLREYEIDLVLIPPESQLDYQLRREGDWRPLYEDDTAVLLRRENATAADR